MDIHTGQRRPFPAVAIVAVLFLLCIVPGQSWIAGLLPGISGLVGINPSLVILDIPNPLPVTIDLILVPGLFLLIYPIVVLLYPSRGGIPSWQKAIHRAGAVFAGLLIWLCCLLSGGLIYYVAQGYLPRHVRNGINSFGINADIHLPFPGYEIIHLRGSMVLLVCFAIGMAIFIRKIKKEPGMQKIGRLTHEQRMTPYQRMLREKRAMEKQLSGQARTTQKSRPPQPPPGPQPAKTRQPAGKEQGVPRPDRNELRGLCHRHPVMTFEPEAVSYMPKFISSGF